AMAATETAGLPRTFFDVHDMHKGYANSAYPYTPSVGLMNTSALSDFRTFWTPARAGCRMLPNSGDRWSMVGISHALRRFSGILVGPGMNTGF
ncbi:MAG: hypothetical protein AAFY39_05685, partial [Pseudomonadota bacterium]